MLDRYLTDTTLSEKAKELFSGGEKFRNFIVDTTLEAVEINSSLKNWAAHYGINLVPNQVEILENIVSPKVQRLAILAARQSGKTFSVGLGVIKLCIENPGYKVICAAPKSDQATRVLNECIYPLCKTSEELRNEVDWENGTTQKQITFKNGSVVKCISCNESTQQEGFTGNLVLVDEAHQVSDFVFKTRIDPMNTGSDDPKTIKIGITLKDNHFKESATKAPGWKVLCYPWYKCQRLYKKNNLINIGGTDYPRQVVDRMPLSMKLKRWPQYPDVHYESTNGMTEEEFKTQYEMEWVETLGGFLTGDEQAKLFSGEHDYQLTPMAEEKYFFGLDFAGGSLIEVGPEHDSTQLVIGRKNPDSTKEIVALYEWQGDTTVQTEEIINIVTNVFPCEFGVADYSTMGIAVVDAILAANIPMAGISFKKTEQVSGKNYKNAIFDQILYEIRHGRVKYPSLKKVLNPLNGEISSPQANLLNKHIIEWGALEREKTATGINDLIHAPEGSRTHDDCPNAAALFVWACDKCDAEKVAMGFYTKNFKIARPSFGGTMTQSRQSSQVGGKGGLFERMVNGVGNNGYNSNIVWKRNK